MRNTARRATTPGPTVTAVCGHLAGTGLAAPHAAPASLYAPSALVLTTGRGESTAAATAERAVTLTRAPRPAGTHPAVRQTCAELRLTRGDLDALTAASPEGRCTREYDPVVVTVDGVREGRRVSYGRAFSHECVKDAATSVFTF